MKFIIRYFYAPVFFAGFIYIAIFIVENEINKLALLLLLLIAIAVSFICERVLPFEAVSYTHLTLPTTPYV